MTVLSKAVLTVDWTAVSLECSRVVQTVDAKVENLAVDWAGKWDVQSVVYWGSR